MKDIFRESHAGIGYLAVCQNLDFRVHIHVDIELVYVKKGASTVYCNGEKHHIQTGDFVLLFPNQIHSYEKTQAGTYYLFIVNPSNLLQYESVFLENVPQVPILHGEDLQGQRIVRLMEGLIEEIGAVDDDVIADYLTLIFGKLLKQYRLNDQKADNDCVSKVLNYCIRNRDSDISVSSVAQALNISTSYVSYIFSRKLAVNFCNYINYLRVNDVKQLLESEQYSVTEIADITGFNTLRTFNRAFLKQTGMTPSQYRSSKKER